MAAVVPAITRFLDSLDAPNGSRPFLINAIEKSKKCGIGYSKRQTCCGKIAGLLYRIWNAIKALIGQSDWQRAKRAIENKNFRLIDVNQEKMRQLDIFLNSEYPTELTCIEDPDSFLHALIKLHESPTMNDILRLERTDLSDEVKSKITEKLKANPKADAAFTFKGYIH
jgi:hypothetical protein